MRLYLAAPLFTAAERQFNLALAVGLEAQGHQVYLPQRDTDQSPGPDRPTQIFRQDLAGLRQAEGVVAVCDRAQVDDGTAWEVGYAVARGIPVYGLRTDPRQARPGERMNLMIEQSLTALADSAEALLGLLPAPSR